MTFSLDHCGTYMYQVDWKFYHTFNCTSWPASFVVADKRHETSVSKTEDFIPCYVS